MDATSDDPSAEEALRLACLPLLAQRKWDDAPTGRAFAARAGQPAALPTSALALLKRFGADKASTLICELLPRYGRTRRRERADGATRRERKTALDLFKRMEKGELSRRLGDRDALEVAARQRRAARSRGEALGQPSEDGASVITKLHRRHPAYQRRATRPGNLPRSASPATSTARSASRSARRFPTCE